jgi:hypothetical protein
MSFLYTLAEMRETLTSYMAGFDLRCLISYLVRNLFRLYNDSWFLLNVITCLVNLKKICLLYLCFYLCFFVKSYVLPRKS